MNFLRQNIPNLLTCLNLTCGLIGLVLLAENGIEALPELCILVFLAGIADFLDGFAARLLGSASPIGKDLDSLADAVTFGVLPGLAGYICLKDLQAGELAWLALSTPIFSVIRLARFNNDPGQSDSFTGVPTPANAFFLIFLFERIFFGDGIMADVDMNASLLTAIILVSSLLLVSPFRIISLKVSRKGLKANLDKYLLLASSLLLAVFLHKDAVAVVYPVYLLLSFAFQFIRTENKITG
jgi:CDP-diacylglycerol--serine O-phosphatidyltransferase